MWQEAKLPGVPPNASDQASSEQLLFDLWRPGGMPHPPGAMDLSSADPDCLAWRARVAWLQHHWLQHSHYAGCFAKKDTCKANFPMAPNNQSRATAFVAGVNGGGPQVVSGLAVPGNAVLDLTVGDALGGGKRKTARDRASKRHKKTPANAVAADHQTSSANQTHLLDVPAQSICPEADVLDLTGGASGPAFSPQTNSTVPEALNGPAPEATCPGSVRASGRKRKSGWLGPKKSRSQFVDDEAHADDHEADEDDDLEGSCGLQDGSDDDFVAAPDSSNPGDEALSNRLLDIERDGMEADETRDFAQRYEAAALAGDMAEGYESLADCLGARVEVNASGPGSSAADCVNSSSRGCVTSLKFEEKRTDLDCWLVSHSLALVAMCKSNCNIQAITSQTVTWYVTKYISKPNPDSARDLRYAIEGAEKALARAAAARAQAVVGKTSLSASARLAAEEEQQRLEFSRGLSVLCSAVRDHTKEESSGAPRACYINLRQDIYMCSHRFANLILAQGLAVMQNLPVGGRIRHGSFVSSIEDYLHRPLELNGLSLFSFTRRFETVDLPPKPATLRGRARLAYLDSHPRVADASVVERHTPVLVRIVGPRLPNVDLLGVDGRQPTSVLGRAELEAERQLYALCALVMHKPWRIPSDLVPLQK